jgi:hypothetical protein
VSAEVKVQPGWLIKDVRKASQRLNEWSKALRSDTPALAARRRAYQQTRHELTEANLLRLITGPVRMG